MNSILTMKDLPTLEVHCNWDSNIPDKSIHNAVLLKHCDKDTHEIENLNDTVNVETTVSFVAPERHMDKPIVYVKIPAQESLYVSAISLLCDSKTIEVFGDHSIYLDTVNGTAVEEADEFYVYEYKIDLNKRINKEISLKFMKLPRPNSLWIYGILLKLKKINHSPSVSINFENVQELLKNAHISDQASKAFSFLRDANTSARFHANGGGALPKPQDNLPELKQYIDYKFQILMDYLIVRDKAMNDRIDRLVEIMKSKN